MAVSPVFWDSQTGAGSKDALLSSLRFKVEFMDSFRGQVDASLNDVRLGLYRRLTVDRVNEILTTPFAENPATDAEIIRSTAARAEATWLKIRLLLELPQLWMDASNSTQHQFNDDPFTRERTDDSQALIDDLQLQLEQYLAVLVSDEVTQDSSLQINTFPETGYQAGSSVFGTSTLFGNNNNP